MAWGQPAAQNELLIERVRASDPALTALHLLPFRRLSDEELTQLMAAVKTNTALQELGVVKPLPPSALEALADALTFNRRLRTLSAGNNTLADEGVAILCRQGLQHNEGLRCVDFSLKGMGPAGAAAVGHVLWTHKTVVDVSLCDNLLGDDGLRNLLRGYRVAADATVATPAGCKLEVLRLDRVGLTGAGGSALGSFLSSPATNTALANLTVISLNGNNLATSPEDRQDCLELYLALGRLPKLVTLEMDGCQIGDRGVETLCLGLLDRLHAGCASASFVKKLRLGNNNLSAVAASNLAHLLASAEKHLGIKMPHLLALSGNKLGDSGAELLASASSVARLEDVDRMERDLHIDLSKNDLTPKALAAFATKSCMATTLEFLGNDFSSLTLDGDESLQAKVLLALRDGDVILPKLRSLDLSGVYLREVDVVRLVQLMSNENAMPNLKILSLGDILTSEQQVRQPRQEPGDGQIEEMATCEEAIAELKMARPWLMVAWKFLRPEEFEEQKQQYEEQRARQSRHHQGP